MVNGCRQGCKVHARGFLGAQGDCRGPGSFFGSWTVSELWALNRGAMAVWLDNRPIAEVGEGCNLTCLSHCEKGRM